MVKSKQAAYIYSPPVLSSSIYTLNTLHTWIWAQQCKRYTSTHLTFQVSQGSAATDLRWGKNFNTFLFRNSLMYIAVKKLWKSVNICQSYHKNKRVSFFMAHSVHCCATVNHSLHAYSIIISATCSHVVNSYQQLTTDQKHCRYVMDRTGPWIHTVHSLSSVQVYSCCPCSTHYNATQ